jgi:hypothetical protein
MFDQKSTIMNSIRIDLFMCRWTMEGRKEDRMKAKNSLALYIKLCELAEAGIHGNPKS